MMDQIRGWFATHANIGKARKCLILQKTVDGYDWQRTVWFHFKGDKSTIALDRDKKQFIYPSDFGLHQKNVDVYFKAVEDGAPVVFNEAKLERRAGVYPDPYAVHLWGAQKVVSQLLAGASANLVWVLVGWFMFANG